MAKWRSVLCLVFGQTDEKVAVIGQGTWQVRDQGAAVQAIEEGIRLGLTHLDTAELYEWRSRSETMLGSLLSRPSPGGGTLRDRVFLASKVWPTNGSRKGVQEACQRSLGNLRTDRLDLYYHHWRDGPVPLEETLGALADLRKEGLVRHVGVSNYDVADLDEAKSILGAGILAANQVLYHLDDRGAESGVLPWCKRNGVAVVAYSPLGAGRFVQDKRRRAVLEEVAKEAGLTARQAALAFLTRDEAVFAIPKAESLEHVRDNAGGDARLSAEHVERLDAAFPVKPGLRTA